MNGAQRCQLLAGRVRIALGHQRPPPGVVPHPSRVWEVHRRCRHGKQFIPALEAHQHLQMTRHVMLQEGHARLKQHRLGNQFGDLARRLQCLLAASDHAGSEGQEIVLFG